MIILERWNAEVLWEEPPLLVTLCKLQTRIATVLVSAILTSSSESGCIGTYLFNQVKGGGRGQSKECYYR